ncbi:MAG TPA: hypothetical protein VEA63_00970, partial [Opitutus sp.]|nr:hypothetical protein [Opitutus sp.]
YVAKAAGLKLESYSQQVETAVSLQRVSARTAKVKHLDLGRVRIKGAMAFIISNDDLVNVSAVSAAWGDRLDGVLGMATVADVLLEIDYPRKQVSVALPAAHFYPVERAVSYRDRGGVPEVVLEIGGRMFPMDLDTGALATAITVDDATGLELVHPWIKQDGGDIGIGTDNVRRERSQLAGDARLGPITWRNPPLSKSLGARIGLDALSSWRLVFDQREQKIYFLDAEPGLAWEIQAPPDPQRMLGFFGEIINGAAVRLGEVDGGKAFDRAGLRAGDILETVNGVPAFLWLVSDWDRAEPEQLRIRAVRAGIEFEVTAVRGLDEPIREVEPQEDAASKYLSSSPD